MSSNVDFLKIEKQKCIHTYILRLIHKIYQILETGEDKGTLLNMCGPLISSLLDSYEID